MRLCPAQVHAQKHFCPVLRFGAAGTGLDIQECIIGIQLAGKHAAEFERANLLLEGAQVADDFIGRVLIILVCGELEQLSGIGETGAQFIENDYDLFELGPLLPQCLGPLGIIPDIRLFEFALDFGQAFRLAFVVKDTPSTHRCVPRDP